ncbi:hypothetical protein C8Q74DRAFT_1442268 [Fomes fomentarius]|nr:hypothetical protein C8Q74DRAFT_1442268 [Fomes fomentarius]
MLAVSRILLQFLTGLAASLFQVTKDKSAMAVAVGTVATRRASKYWSSRVKNHDQCARSFGSASGSSNVLFGFGRLEAQQPRVTSAGWPNSYCAISEARALDVVFERVLWGHMVLDCLAHAFGGFLSWNPVMGVMSIIMHHGLASIGSPSPTGIQSEAVRHLTSQLRRRRTLGLSRPRLATRYIIGLFPDSVKSISAAAVRLLTYLPINSKSLDWVAVAGAPRHARAARERGGYIPWPLNRDSERVRTAWVSMGPGSHGFAASQRKGSWTHSERQVLLGAVAAPAVPVGRVEYLEVGAKVRARSTLEGARRTAILDEGFIVVACHTRAHVGRSRRAYIVLRAKADFRPSLADDCKQRGKRSLTIDTQAYGLRNVLAPSESIPLGGNSLPESLRQSDQTHVVPGSIKTGELGHEKNISAHVGFPAEVAGTNPEGHEEACARNDHKSGRPYLGASVLNRGGSCGAWVARPVSIFKGLATSLVLSGDGMSKYRKQGQLLGVEQRQIISPSSAHKASNLRSVIQLEIRGSLGDCGDASRIRVSQPRV